MVNSLIEAISSSLASEFGAGYEFYREVKNQGLKEPCFFIQCLDSSELLLRGNMRVKQSQFCIHYFPNDTRHENKECYKVAERLFSYLEVMKTEEGAIRGTQARYRITGGVLQFFITYNQLYLRLNNLVPQMEEASHAISMKE